VSIINPLNNTQPVAGASQPVAPAPQTTLPTQTSTTGNPFLDAIRLPEDQSIPEANNQELTQEDFFSLLSQQLSMQDPFKPVDNDQMIAQMASFSTVDGISNLNDEIINLNAVMTSSQALQASGLVGQKVLIPSDTGFFEEGQNLKGVVSTPEAIKEIKLRVEDEKGQLIDTFTANGSEGGNIDVSWKGIKEVIVDADGNETIVYFPDGNYSIKASGMIDGENQELAVSAYAHVTSVSLGNASTGAILNLRSLGSVKIGDVLAVSES